MNFFFKLITLLVELTELRRQVNQLDSDYVEEFTMKQKPSESEFVQINDPAVSYIKDILVTSGLCFGSWNKYLFTGNVCKAY